MRTFSLLKGLPVYNLKDGTRIGNVCDLTISNRGFVEGLLIKRGVFFKQTYFLATDKVTSFGWDGVMVDGVEQVEKLKAAPQYTVSHQRSLFGKMLISKSGESLGLLEDVYFLEKMGTIVGYEVTDGFFTDITEGKHMIESRQPPAIGKDTIIIDVKNT